MAAASPPACCSPSQTPPFSTPHWPKGRSCRRNTRRIPRRHFMREVNRLGVTGVIDAGGGFQNYPEDYAIVEELHRAGN